MENNQPIPLRFENKQPLVTENFKFISTYDFEITEYELEKIRRKLNETEEKKKKCLEELREKLGSDEIIKYRKDDIYLLRYLRYCKYDCERAHKIIRHFYNIRIKYPEYFDIPPNLENLFNRGFLTYLPYTDEDGCLLLWINFRKWNLDEISVPQLIQMMFIFADIISMNPRSQINGCLGIWDFRGANIKHFAHILRPSILWLFANVLQDCYPWKLKYVVGIHCNRLIRTTYNGLKYLLKNKHAARIMLHGSDLSDLHQYVNPLLLPKEYGGSVDENECLATTENIVQNLKYLQYERTFGTIIGN